MAESGVTQRVAAILAADVAGYTRLMADDETATINALDAARAVFAEHSQANQGRIVDTAGDSVLAVFETTAGAARAAMAIQAQLAEINDPVPEPRRMQFRIGIHLGDIHEKAAGTIYGDGVNIAARLEGLAEPGAIMVSDVVQGVLRDRLDVAFADAGSHEVKNVKNPVRAYRVLAEGETAPVAPGRKRRLVLGGVGFVVILVGATFWQLRTPAPEPSPPPTEVATTEPENPILPLPTGPSIAVVPFDNLSGDPDQDYFSDGITEDVLVALSRFRSLFVIGKDSTIRYKGTQASAKDIGSDLGVAYVLKGSVQRTADVIRISTQLLSAEDGSIVWSDRFDRPLTAESLFAIQDEITGQVVATLAGTFGILDQARYEDSSGARSESLVSYECVLRAKKFYFTWSVDMFLEARSCLEGVIEAEPDYADAWAWLAVLVQEEYSNGFPAKPDAYERSRTYARRAIAIAPNNQIAWVAMVEDHFFRREIDEFVLAADRVIALNPNESFLVGAVGLYLCHAEMCERGLALLDRAKQLSPHHVWWMHIGPARYHFNRGEYDEALAALAKIDVPYTWKLVMRPAALAHLGRLDDARETLDQLREIAPDYPGNMREDLTLFHWTSDQIDLLEDGLRKAGLFDEPDTPSRPVIAVLPFDSMSGDAEHQFFADGIAEDIITRLARFPDIGVIARNSSFQHKGENVDVRTVAEELGATYVLEGSVRRSENDIRVIAQLLDAADGTHLWAETYDRDLSAGSVFEIQDEITERVVGAIASADSIIAQAVVEASSGKAPENLASYECVLRAFEYWRVIAPDSHLRARACLARVVAEEPDYAQAYVVLAGLELDEHLYGFNVQPDQPPPLDRSLRHARRAIDLDPKSGWSHWALARTSFFRHDLGTFRSETEKALELAPNDTLLLASAGVHIAYSGGWDEGLSHMARAIKLNPHHQTWYHIPYFYNAYRRGDDQAALAVGLRINMPGFFWIQSLLAAAYGQLGMAGEAASAVASLQELYPGYSIETMTEIHRQYNFEDEVVARMADGLRKAGLPENSD